MSENPKYTFGSDVTFPAPGSTLHSIAQEGVVPLFEFWDKMTREDYRRRAAAWASSYWFLKYVHNCLEPPNSQLERIDHKATSSGAKEVAKILETAKGVYYIVFDEDGKSFVIDFVDQDRVTVAAMSRRYTIECQNFARDEWTRGFIKDLSRHREGVLADQKSPVETITIIH